MRKVTYSGPATRLGGHGLVQHGDTILLPESEWRHVQGDPRFKLVRERKLQKAENAPDVLPLGTARYDLRTILWSHERLHVILRTRTSRGHIERILGCMEEVGVPVPDISPHASKEELIDLVMQLSRQLGWDKLSDETLRMLPTLAS